MAERGDFRGIYTVLTEDPDFQDLGPDAQLVWFHLKLRLGPSGIDVLDAAEAVLQERSKMPAERVRDGIEILIREGWLIRDRNMLWLRNALLFEPSRNLGNENHRKAVSKHLETLPKRRIVNDFAAAYELPPPFPDVLPSEGHKDGIGVSPPITEDGRRKTEDEQAGAIAPEGQASAEEADEFTWGEVMAVVRDELHRGRNDQETERSGSCLKRDFLGSVPARDVIDACRGTRKLIEEGLVDGAEPGQSVGLRFLRTWKHGSRYLWDAALDRERHGPTDPPPPPIPRAKRRQAGPRRVEARTP